MSSYPDTKGSDVEEYTCNGSKNQSWDYAFSAGLGAEGNWEFISVGAPYCLDNYQTKFTDGNPQILWGCTSGSAIPLIYGVGISHVSGGYAIHTEQDYGEVSKYCLTSYYAPKIEEYICNTYSANQAFSGATLGNGG